MLRRDRRNFSGAHRVRHGFFLHPCRGEWFPGCVDDPAVRARGLSEDSGRHALRSSNKPRKRGGREIGGWYTGPTVTVNNLCRGVCVVTSFLVELPPGVSADEVVRNQQGRGDIAVTGPEHPNPDVAAVEGTPAIAFATSVSIGGQPGTLAVTVETIGDDHAHAPRIASLEPEVWADQVDAKTGEPIGHRIASFVATLENPDALYECLEDGDEIDSAVLTDDDENDDEPFIDGGPFFFPREPLPTDESVLREHPHSAPPVASFDRRNDVPQDEMNFEELRAAILAEPGRDVVEQCTSLVRKLEPHRASHDWVELSRRVNEVLKLAALPEPGPADGARKPARSSSVRLVDPKQVPLATTSRGVGGSGSAAVDLRYLAGRNRTERAISFLENHRPGFRDIDWESKVAGAAEFLRTAPGVIDVEGV